MTDPDPNSTRSDDDAGTAEETSLVQTLRAWLKTARKPRNGNHLRDAIGELIEEESGDASLIDDDERRLLRNILNLHDVTVADVMVPRADIVAIEENAPLGEVVDLVGTSGHSRIPVYRGTLDDVVGMVHIKDLLKPMRSHRKFRLPAVLRKLLIAVPSMRVLELLLEMRTTRRHMALVVDEYGGIDGLVTIEDLVEEIVGEIEDEHDDTEGPRLERGSDGVLTADARATVEEFETCCGRVLSEEEREDVDTLGGLVFALAGRVPARGELIRHPSGIEFEVVEADPRKIRRLRVRNLPPSPPPDPAA